MHLIWWRVRVCPHSKRHDQVDHALLVVTLPSTQAEPLIHHSALPQAFRDGDMCPRYPVIHRKCSLYISRNTCKQLSGQWRNANVYCWIINSISEFKSNGFFMCKALRQEITKVWKQFIQPRIEDVTKTLWEEARNKHPAWFKCSCLSFKLVWHQISTTV